MKIGYPCINRSIRDIRLRTFRLSNLSEAKLFNIVENNLNYLEEVLKYNVEHGFGFFRIHSDTIPFASHRKCTIDWQSRFEDRLGSIGAFIKKHDMRISMHPDHFTLLNSPRGEVVTNSMADLRYHTDLLDLMGLDASAKIQIHIGGVYGDRAGSIERFMNRFEKVEESIRRRLALENDDTSYSVADTLEVHRHTGIPLIIDVLHHKLLNNGESLDEVMRAAANTWSAKDGIPLVDYSCQQPGGPIGRHADTLDDDDFLKFIRRTSNFEFDLMLEIRDKERSAARALDIVQREKEPEKNENYNHEDKNIPKINSV